MEFFLSYGLFIAKIITIMIVLILSVLILCNINYRKQNKKGNLKITNLSKIYYLRQREIRQVITSVSEYKSWLKKYNKECKIEKKKQKANIKSGQIIFKKPCLFIINFKGSINAEEVNELREVITVILSIADKKDKVLIKLESYGGTVNGYGLAAAQLIRIKEKGIPLIISVDKAAASGGYMMACVATHIVAAPFAIIGSIGVVGQIPNIYRFLKKQNIDIELHTVGEYKRTLTSLGKNTEQDRKKFIQNLNEIHQLFKNFVHEKRPNLNIDNVATGQCWYGCQAKEKGLIDEIGVSDDIIINHINTHEIIEVSYNLTKNFINKILNNIIGKLNKILLN